MIATTYLASALDDTRRFAHTIEMMASQDQARTTLVAPILSVRGLQMHFFTDAGVARAVDGVAFDVHRGRTLALVGESGCASKKHRSPERPF